MGTRRKGNYNRGDRGIRSPEERLRSGLNINGCLDSEVSSKLTANYQQTISSTISGAKQPETEKSADMLLGQQSDTSLRMPNKLFGQHSDSSWRDNTQIPGHL